MTIALVIDTETTHAKVQKDPASQHNPKLCQIWMGLFDYDPNEVYLADVNNDPHCTATPIGALNTRVIPTEPPIQDAIDVHGLTMDKLEKTGASGDSVAYLFADLVQYADYLVAHNTWFDTGVMRHHLSLYDLDPALVDKPEHFCTMTKLQPIMKLTPKVYGDWKRPRLEQAYEFVFKRPFEGEAHDASADGYACADLYFACRFMEKLGP